MGLRPKHSGSRSSRRRSTSSGHRRGSTTSIPGTSSLKLLRPVILPVRIVREKNGVKIWTSDSLKPLSTKLQSSALEVLASIYLGNHSSTLACLKLWLISKGQIGYTPSFLPQMAHTSMGPWTKLLGLVSIKSSGHGDPKPPSHQKRRRS